MRALAPIFLLVWLVISIAPVRAEECIASFYGSESGSTTANGEHFNPNALTAATPFKPAKWKHPFGTRLRVSYRGRSVIVRVNDRGPAARLGRCIDLSRESARRLGLIADGVGKVTIEKVP